MTFAQMTLAKVARTDPPPPTSARVKHDIRPEICAINCRILGTRFWPWMDKVGWLVHEKGDVVFSQLAASDVFL